MVTLEKLGYVHIAAPTSRENEYGPFQLTPAGLEAAARYRASR
jgi:hypothetical protein